MSDWDDESQEEVLIGVAKMWSPPKGNGPGRFELWVDGQTKPIKCQVWPFEYQTNEENPTYADCKYAATENQSIMVTGKGEWQTFTSTQGKSKGQQVKTYSFTVYNLDGTADLIPTEDGEVPKETADLLLAAQATAQKILDEKRSNRRSQGSGGTSSNGTGSGGSSDRMSKEEWADKDMRKNAAIEAAWSIQTAVANLTRLNDKTSVAREAKALLQLKHDLERQAYQIRKSSSMFSSTDEGQPDATNSEDSALSLMQSQLGAVPVA